MKTNRKYERILRRLRSSPKLWESETEEQVERLISKCKERLMPKWERLSIAQRQKADERFLRLWH